MNWREDHAQTANAIWHVGFSLIIFITKWPNALRIATWVVHELLVCFDAQMKESGMEDLYGCDHSELLGDGCESRS